MLKILTGSEDRDPCAPGDRNLTRIFLSCNVEFVLDLIALIPGDLLAVSPGHRPAAVGAPHPALEAAGAPPRGAGLGLVIDQLLLVSACDFRNS